jgi:hypothetical protein
MSEEFEGKKCDECHQNKQETVDLDLPDGTHTVVCRECVEAIVEQFQAEEAIIPQPEPLTPRQGLAEYKKGYAQAELDLKREPLSEDVIWDALPENPLECAAFIRGVIWAEQQHDITGGEE